MPKFVKHWRLSGCDKAFRAHVVAHADDLVILSRGHAAEALTWTKAVMTKLGPRYPYRGNGQWYWGASPSKKSVQRLKTKVRNLLVPANNAPWHEVRDKLNRSLRGWSNYFCHGTRRPAFRGVDFYVRECVRPFLVRRHKVAGRGKHQFSFDVLHGRGVLCLEQDLRCDERRWETECWP
jgi:RNA-directed DNA polymerase